MKAKQSKALLAIALTCGLAYGYLGCTRAKNDTTKFGSILDMTGVGASYGKRMKQSFELALADAQTGEAGHKNQMSLIVEDFQWDTAKALTAYRKLTNIDGVKVIVGITGSKNAKPVAEASRSDDVVIIDALTSSPTLTRQGGPNYFRIMASDAFAGRFNAQWASASGMRRCGILYVEDEWGASYRDQLKKYLSDLHADPVVEQASPAGSRDYRAQIARLKQSRIDVLFLILYPPDAGIFMQQARQDGLSATVYGSDNLSAPEFTAPGAKVVEGVRLALPAAVGGSAYDGFRKRYMDRYHEEADTIAAKSYDAMSVAIDVVNKVGNNPSNIRTLLKSGNYSFPGLTGRIEFDANGDLVSQDYSKMIYQGGKLVPFEHKP